MIINTLRLVLKAQIELVSSHRLAILTVRRSVRPLIQNVRNVRNVRSGKRTFPRLPFTLYPVNDDVETPNTFFASPTDIDECAVDDPSAPKSEDQESNSKSVCPSEAKCVNFRGGFKCECLPGFKKAEVGCLGEEMVNDDDVSEEMKFEKLCASGNCNSMPSKQKMQIKVI